LCDDGIALQASDWPARGKTQKCCQDSNLGFLPGWYENTNLALTPQFTTCTNDGTDGIRASPIEECDDGNSISGDGCSNNAIDFRWSCYEDITGKSVCQRNCGNGKRDDGEVCDDLNEVSGDGCTSNCKVEIGYSCIGGTSTSEDTCYPRPTFT